MGLSSAATPQTTGPLDQRRAREVRWGPSGHPHQSARSIPNLYERGCRRNGLSAVPVGLGAGAVRSGIGASAPSGDLEREHPRRVPHRGRPHLRSSRPRATPIGSGHAPTQPAACNRWTTATRAVVRARNEVGRLRRHRARRGASRHTAPRTDRRSASGTDIFVCSLVQP